jgi:predicted nucleic acid-binding protein
VIVVDASALADLLTGPADIGRAVRVEVRKDLDWCAPDHVTAEVFSAVRGQFLGGRLDADEAREALSAFATMGVRTLHTSAFLDRMWELRDNASGYDAAYLAAAERYDCALVTTDRRLAAVPGARCEVRVALPAS